MAHRIAVVCLTLGAVGVSGLWAQMFDLTDSDPDGPAFEARFMASYGVNAAIEPQLAEADRVLFEKVLPLLREEPRQAIDLLEKEVTPESNAAFDFLLGNLYYSIQDYTEAERRLRRAVEKHPSFRRAYRSLALSAVQRGAIVESVPLWLKVISLGGGDAQSYGLLGYAYLTNEQYKSGLKAYEMARMFDPDSVDFKRGEAQCLLMTRQHDEAIALFDELIAAAPGEPDFWKLQANAYLATQQNDAAIANLEIAAELETPSWESRLLLGDLYLSKGVFHLATEAYESAVRQHPEVDPTEALKPLERLLGYRLFDEAGRYIDALESAATSDLPKATQQRIIVAKAQIQLESGESKQAAERLERLVEADPLHGQALLVLGEAKARDEQYEEAVYYLERALSVPEFETDALVALGRLEVDRGRFDVAVDYLRRAQAKEPRDNVQRYLERVAQAMDGRAHDRRVGRHR